MGGGLVTLRQSARAYLPLRYCGVGDPDSLGPSTEEIESVVAIAMCLLAIQYRLVPESPILVATNREEYYDRRSSGPTILAGKPRILCPVDVRAGGTWLGVNQNGLFVGMCNRRMMEPIAGNRSRGLMVKEALKAVSAAKALEIVQAELRNHIFEGFNLVLADRDMGFVVQHDMMDEVRELETGLNIIGQHNLNDHRDERVQMAKRLLTLQTLDSPVKFLAVASRVFSRTPSPPGRPSMVMRGNEYGTVSSTLLALGAKPRDAILQYADGSPDEARYEDYSPALRDILSRGLRESRGRVNTV